MKDKDFYIYMADPTQLWNMLVETWNEKEDLNKRINKAIEYIEKNTVLFMELHKQGNYFINCNADKLLQILKGSNVK